MEVINWLNENDGAIIGVATAVLVCITGYYAYLTRRLLKANDIPEIAISLRPHEAHVNAVMLYLENIGTGAARNLQFVTSPSVIPNLDIPLEKISFLRNGIAFFEPRRKIEQLLVIVIGKEKLNELRQTPLKITVTYEDSVNHRHERIFELDFGEYEGFSQFGTPPFYEIAKATKDIQKDLHRITTGSRKPIVLTESLSEHRLGQRAYSLESRIEQFPDEVQQEILQEVNVFISKREQEVLKKDRDKKADPDADLP